MNQKNQLLRNSQEVHITPGQKTQRNGAQVVNKQTLMGKKKKRQKKQTTPLEVSSKHPYTPKTSNSFLLHRGKNSRALRAQPRDPRFSELSGTLNKELCAKSYAFLTEMHRNEMVELKNMLKTGKKITSVANSSNISSARDNYSKVQSKSKLTSDEKADISRRLKRMRSQDSLRKHQMEVLEMKRKLQKGEKQKVARTGKRPYFVGKSKVRKLVHEEKREGKKVLYKRRKEQKAAAKEKKMNSTPIRRLIHEE